MTTTLWDIGERNGKTSRLIEYASQRSLYIITVDDQRAFNISMRAAAQKKPLLHPLTVQEVERYAIGSAYVRTHPGVLVDDAAEVLEKFIGMPILGAASRGELVQHKGPSGSNITRCVDCAYRHEGMCMYPDGNGDFRRWYVDDEDFCSKGERPSTFYADFQSEHPSDLHANFRY